MPNKKRKENKERERERESKNEREAHLKHTGDIQRESVGKGNTVKIHKNSPTTKSTTTQ